MTAIYSTYTGALQGGSARLSMSSTVSTTPAQNTPKDDAPRDFSLVAQDARGFLDAQYQALNERGTRVVFDISQDGVAPDFSSLSDRAVAAIALNQDGQFSKDEALWAQGTLFSRMEETIGPTLKSAPDDLRPFFAGLLDLYDSLDTEVLDALGLTQDKKDIFQQILKSQEEDLGTLPLEDGYKGVLGYLDWIEGYWNKKYSNETYTPYGSVEGNSATSQTLYHL